MVATSLFTVSGVGHEEYGTDAHFLLREGLQVEIGCDAEV